MSLPISKKDHLSIPFDIDKCRVNNQRYNAFIKSCVKELKHKGETICFNQKQIDEIKKQIDIIEIIYDERNDCYYLFSKA